MKGRTSESDPQTCQADRILRNLVHVPRRDDKTAWVLTCPSRVWRVVRCCKAKYQPKKVLFQRERPSMRFKHLRWDRPLPRQLTQGRFKCATSLGRRNNTLSHNQNQSESLTSTYIHLHITSKSIILSQMCFSSYNRRQPCWSWCILVLCSVMLGAPFVPSICVQSRRWKGRAPETAHLVVTSTSTCKSKWNHVKSHWTPCAFYGAFQVTE